MTLWAWHVHHDILVEPLTETIKTRIAFIKANKPTSEVETRLRLLKPVKGRLPVGVIKAWEAYDKARAAYNKARAAYSKASAACDKAWAAYSKASAAYDKAWAAYNKARVLPAILKLHAKECPNCPWDGKTIFPEAFR